MTASASLAARAVAAGPPTLAPPSFEGHDWLYVVNIFVFTAGFALCSMFCLKLVTDHFLCWVAPRVVPDGERWWSRGAIQGRFPRAARWVVALVSAILGVLGPRQWPGPDDWRSPIMLLRRIGILWSFAYALRCFSEMQSLLHWYPLDPVGTGRSMALKRELDPIAANIGYTALALFFLSLPGMTEQLRKKPFPINMWTSLPLLKRPAGVVVCCLGIAVAVVVFR